MTTIASRPPVAELSDGPPDGAGSVNEELPFPIRAAKLRPIAPRLGVVRRRALLERLDHSDLPVTTIIAPAGYGKTAVLAQWVEEQRAPVAWLTADDGDNDPTVLCTYLAAAIEGLVPPRSEAFRSAGSIRPATLLSHLLADVEALTKPVTLVIDQLGTVSNPECVDLIWELAAGIPDGVRLFLSSRFHLPVPAVWLRAERRLLEIGARDLAFNTDEAASLLIGAGVDPDQLDLTELVDRTEGWPAGLCLAALAMQVGGPRPETSLGLRGHSRFVGDYFRVEILDHLSPHAREFLMRTSILDSLSGPLCDATLDTVGSAAMLEEIHDRGLLVVPIDDRREEFRYHRLFGELLRSELERREPERMPFLHSRAAAWYQADGQLEAALRHAQAGKDHDRFAFLVQDLVQPVWASGRAATVMRWLEWLADEDLLGRYPELTVQGALLYASLGYPAEAEAWAAAAERSPVTGEAGDGSSIEGLLAYMRAFLCRDGVESMKTDSIAGYTGLSPTSPYRGSMLFTEGLALLVDGDPEKAEPKLVRAADAAEAIGSVPIEALVLATLGSIAGHRDDWIEATELGDRALDRLGDETFDEYWTSALVFALGARIALRSGQIDTARDRLAKAERLRPLLTYALPVVSVITLLEMGRVHFALGDHASARTAMRRAGAILRQRPGLGLLGRELDELRAEFDVASGVSAGVTGQGSSA